MGLLVGRQTPGTSDAAWGTVFRWHRHVQRDLVDRRSCARDAFARRNVVGLLAHQERQRQRGDPALGCRRARRVSGTSRTESDEYLRLASLLRNSSQTQAVRLKAVLRPDVRVWVHKRRRAPICAVWSRKGTQFGTQSPDAGGYVRGAGRPMIASSPGSCLPQEG